MLAPVLLLAITATAAPADLVAAAAASSRPEECRGASTWHPGASKSIWTTARAPELLSYCRWLARANARLASDPAGAASAAEAAAKLLPSRAAPKVVLGRIAFAQGKTAEALKRFDEALALDPRSIEQPLAMHDLARTRTAAGKLTDALGTYRLLAPRVSLLPNRQARARALLEAAHVALAAPTPDATTAQRQVQEALAYLRQAQRDPHQPLRRDITLSLVLALDRAGRRPQADAVLAELRTSGTSTDDEQARSYLVVKAEGHLFRALIAERRDAEMARAAYDQYLAEVPSGAYAETARARRARLAPKRDRRRRRRGR
ncbi:MAG TPA: hypothetical protein ENK57_13295 [Polyangiaceae bacterium]|nr:hypothetical protein [Polyangiaceae bacterium]